MRVFLSSSFLKAYKKLPAVVVDLFAFKREIFFKDPFDIQLKTHKLHGTQRGLYSFSLDRKYRVIFCFDENADIVLIKIGKHDIYQ
ncbi:MAG: type II toxin-antitoxin system mRNA interferase toxin, RelE/StbE family [Patescibacteria group bacterium]